jgi:hypothetical protein
MKNIRFFLLMIFSLFCFSCAEDLEYDFPGEDVNKVYIKPNNFTVNGYDRSTVQLIKTSIGVFQNGMHFPEVSCILNANDNIVLKYVIDPSLVEKYNVENNTNYKGFLKDWGILENNEIIISANSTKGKSDVAFAVNNDYLNDIENGEYLLPIRIEKISGDALISENRNAHYFVINVYQDEDNIADITLEDGGELLTEDRTGWGVECFNSWFGAGDVTMLFDNKEDRSIFFNLDRNETERGLIIDMKKEYSNISGFYQACSSNYYLLKSADIYTSIDKSSWDYQGNYQVSETKSSILFYQPIQARYLKLVVKETGFMGIYFSELNILQK